MRVLILDGHSRAALESAQSLGRRGAEIDLACETEHCLAFRSRYVANRLAQPPSNPAADALEWLVHKHAERNYDLVIPSTDVGLQLLRALDEDDPVRARAVLPCNRSLDIALDKVETHRLARALGIPVPRATTIPQGGAIPERSSFPVVLKSRRSRVIIDGANCRLEAFIAMDQSARDRVLAGWLPHTAVQEQEFVHGRGFGVEMLFDHGRALWHFAHERIHEMPLTGGGSSYRRSIAPPPQLLQMAERLLGELAWHGVAMVEFRGDGMDRHYLMEINPRLWGSLALSIDCGVDFPAALAALARGEPVARQPRYRVGYFTRDPLTDAQWHRENLRVDHSNPLLLTRPRIKSALELLRPLYGRESWDHFDWHDLRVTTSMLKELFGWVAERFASRLKRFRMRRGALGHHEAVKHACARRGRPSRLLFLCHGNICRSPIAARIAEREIAGLEIRSAGFHEIEGRRAPPHVRRAAAGTAYLRQHRSRRVNATDVTESDLILCMDLANLDSLGREFPQALGRTTLLGLFAPQTLLEIADLYPLSEADAREVIACIYYAVLGLRAWLETVPIA